MRWTLIILALMALLLGILLVSPFDRGTIISSYNKYRVLLLNGGGKGCLDELEQAQAVFTPLGNRGTETCPVKNAVRISQFKDTTLSSSVILSCPAAVDTAHWVADINAKHIVHMGTINCREMRGRGVMSEHSFGLAIDISEIDGAVVSKHWQDNGSKGEKLRGAARRACKYFSNVLTPNSNILHRNHFHFDNGIGFRCDVRKK